MNKKVSIRGLDKAAVLAVLFNAARQGPFAAERDDMDYAEAKRVLDSDYHNMSFVYLHGRLLKISLHSSASFDPAQYDKSNGLGAAQEAIDRHYNAIIAQAT